MKVTAALFLSTLVSPLLAQRLVLPDNHNLMEASTYGTNAGGTNQWTTAARRFQIIYEASHFTGKAGIPAGGVLVTRVMFRGEDGESNSGGQVYSNVTVELGSTSVTAAAMATTFGATGNRNPATTTMGTLGTVASLPVAPSVGSCPNNYCIDIDLLACGAAFVYDPHNTAQPNLIIDITVPTAPTQVAPQALIPIQNTTAHGAGIRGKSVYTATIAAATGTADTTPPVVGIEFIGAGGQPTEMPARAEYIGGGCGGQHATFYQAFTQDQPFDLAGGITLIPDVYPSPTAYNVVPGSAPIDLTQLNASANTTVDDGAVVLTLPYTLGFPSGSTTSLRCSANGWVGTDASITGVGYQPTRGQMLGSTAANGPRFMPFWTDLNAERNTSMGPLVGLHVKNDTSGGPGNTVSYITWNNMGTFRTPAFSGHASWTLQMVVFEATGIVEYRYGTMQPFLSTLWTPTMENALIVGFTRGRITTSPLVLSLDPQSRDLSHELPYSTSVEGTTSNVSLTAVGTPVAGSVLQTARMFGGQSLTWNVSNIPAGTILAFLNLDLGASQPGLQFPPVFGITAPGCMISTTVNPLILGWEQWVVPGSSVTGVNALAVPHGWEGTVISAQAIGLDVFGGPYLVPWSSNTIKYTVGLD